MVNSTTAIRQLKELERLGGVKKMRLAAEGWREEWQTLIAILMSARTRDEITVVVAEKLFKRFTTLPALAEAKGGEVSAIIGPVNFFQNKTKYVIAIAKVLAESYGGVPPRDLQKLVELPGVGRKTANVFLSEYGADAIGVDTHVSYISQKLGWTKHSHPNKIEKDLEVLFPRNCWSRVNRVCVRFGKTYQSRSKKAELLEKMRILR
ncbi:MAG TPA: endonuclease III [Candidatus Taylorbacteria bacterium]|nr:MAG: Base excision DNA repair protein, HhH-GPD family [Parcubacteria group bacterium GW2011_GWA2_47_64]KKU96604.1 MAG: Base excision DNA repair protein, HhH-GPD family [Parcubacteria group bacterium GW2011_GWC2_48_17]HBV01281.1 endonuclease III [Candidatus Taylorbacteria bacterium]